LTYVHPFGASTIKHYAKKARALAGSTFGVNGRFRSNIQTKQEAVDSLNLFNDTVLITVMFLPA